MPPPLKKQPKLNTAPDYFSRGYAWRQKQDYDRAISDYTDAINFHPLVPDPFYKRGNAYLHKNDNEHAIADFRRAYELSGPNGPRRRDALAKLQKLGVNQP
jgi:tetratricopeptide (TPR) repeat protein